MHDTNLEYALCWEDPSDGEEAWVIRVRTPEDEHWDRWLFHPTLTEADEDAAKAWAVAEFGGQGRTVDGWHRDRYGDLIPDFA